MRSVFVLTVMLCPMVCGAEISTRGYVQSDSRVSLPGKAKAAGDKPWQFLRLDNTARLTSRLSKGNVEAHVDFSVIYRTLYSELDFDDMATRNGSDPYHLESDALYLHVSNLFLDGLDLKFGRQILQWGAADQFNPTSLMNPLDLEDPIKFGDRVPNEMVLLSYTAPWSVFRNGVTLFDEFTLSFAVAPYHRPGQLPRDANKAFTDPDLFVQFVHADALKNFAGVQRTLLDTGAHLDFNTTVVGPEPSLENMQFAPRMSMTLLGVDTSVMYYRGFNDVVQPKRIGATLPEDLNALIPPSVSLEDTENLNNLLSLAGPLIEGRTIGIDLQLGYAPIHVVGFDFATSLDAIGGLGLWVEAAVTYHDDVQVLLDGGALGALDVTDIEGGEFWKIAAGMDHSILPWWYVNVQYLHGFVDEFGADNLQDYIVAGTDLKFLSDQLLLRVFGIVQLQDKSHVLYPQITAGFWDNTELSVGAFIMRGDKDSKFGSPVAGQSRLFMNGKYSF